MEPLIAAKAKANLVTSTGGPNPRPLQETAKAEDTVRPSFREAINTRAEVAKIAGVSHDTIHKAKVIRSEATEGSMLLPIPGGYVFFDGRANRAMIRDHAESQITSVDSAAGSPAVIKARSVIVEAIVEATMANVRRMFYDYAGPAFAALFDAAEAQARWVIGGMPLVNDDGSGAMLEAFERAGRVEHRKQIIKSTSDELAKRLSEDLVGEWRSARRRPQDLKPWQRDAVGRYARALAAGESTASAAAQAEAGVIRLQVLKGARGPESALRRLHARAIALGCDPLTLGLDPSDSKKSCSG